MALYQAVINGEHITYESSDGGSYASLADLFAMAVTPVSAFNQATNAIIDLPNSNQGYAEAYAAGQLGGASSDDAGTTDDSALIQPVQVVAPIYPANGSPSAPTYPAGYGLGYGPGYTTGLWLGPVASGDESATAVPFMTNVTAYDADGALIPTTNAGLNPGGGGWVISGPATPAGVDANAPAVGEVTPGISGGSLTPTVTAPNNGGNSTPSDGSMLDFSHIPDAPGHYYVGSQGNYDLWEIVDKDGTKLGWKVILNHDSREIIPGTLHVISTGNATTATSGQINAAGSTTGGIGGGGVNGGVSGTATTPGTTSATGTITTTGTSGLPTPGGNTTSATGTVHIQGNIRHIYIGSSGGYDLWQLEDEAHNLVEWASLQGRSSLEVVPGSSHYVTATVPSGTLIIGAVTSATPAPVPTGPEAVVVASPAGQLLGWGSIAGVVFELLK